MVEYLSKMTTEEEYNLLHEAQMEQYSGTTETLSYDALLSAMLASAVITLPDGSTASVGDTVTLPFTLGKRYELQYADGAFTYVAVDDENALGGKSNPFIADSTKLTDLPLVAGAYYKFGDTIKKYNGSKFVVSLT